MGLSGTEPAWKQEGSTMKQNKHCSTSQDIEILVHNLLVLCCTLVLFAFKRRTAKGAIPWVAVGDVMITVVLQSNR